MNSHLERESRARCWEGTLIMGLSHIVAFTVGGVIIWILNNTPTKQTGSEVYICHVAVIVLATYTGAVLIPIGAYTLFNEGKGQPKEMNYLQVDRQYYFHYADQVRGKWWACITDKKTDLTCMLKFPEKPEFIDNDVPFTITKEGRHLVLHQGETKQEMPYR